MTNANPPLVSVVIPCYNAAPWIRQTVESALGQNYSAVEVIVVDDLSHDDSRAILRSFQDRIRLIENPVNLGVSASRNAAVAAARGAYIAFLDHDDLWHPDKLKRQMELFARDESLGLVFSDAYYETLTGKRWRSFEVDAPARGRVFGKMLYHNFVLCLTTIVSKRALDQIGLFNGEFRCAEDYDLFLRVAEQFAVDYVDAPLATYRIHDKNFSRQLDVCFGEWMQILYRYRQHAGVSGKMGWAFVRRGLDAKKLTYFLKAIGYALKDMKGFARAFQEAWRQRQKSRAREKNK